MKRNLHIALTVFSGVVLAGVPAGCHMPTKEGIAKNSTEYNLVAEKAGNEMLLLNIVRASKRRPMYFTSFGKLSGNMTVEVGTGSLSLPFGKIGKGLNGAYSIAPSAGYTNSPVFDVAVLDTKEFTNGIMTPVSMKTIEYYWSQGWHPEILLHLFIRRIRIPDEKGEIREYVNYPGNPNTFRDFQRQIRTKDWKWDIIEKKVDPNSIGEVEESEASQLKNLMEAQKAGLVLTPAKDNKMTFCLSQPRYVFTRENKKGKKETKTFDESEGTIYLRSPEAILYYLGEILRAEHRTKDPNTPIIYAGSDECETCPARLFYACEGKGEGVTPCVSVEYEETEYIIPGVPDSDKGCCTDRSMHVLSLVSQLIGQQKKSEEVPATATVRVLGR